ncbi:phosphoribosylanthranilate isomerase [Alkalihalobacillus oceani]|uniref:N-(5'-phosphoribosyl)anthranilate isomerase n=1 Tax=Halalkalibacter oceani TaxID=1653776 RepID=A0A9X2IPI0_9BACI|nr:phosphoribosylanthranilate isomerase [Halalkalibacter oceani]
MSPLLKLCGNHSYEDTEIALLSRADYVGFVFAESKRQVTREQVKEWLSRHHGKSRAKIVALFVNASAEQIAATVDGLPIDIIQCHGAETPEQVKEIKKQTGLPVWKVIHHNENALQEMEAYEGIVSGYVVDCKVGKQWGGTGVSFDWNYVPRYITEGRRQKVPVLIAGGIRPENVGELMRYQPDGIDVSSGIEQGGRKSRALVEQLEERMNNHGSDLSR